MIETVYRSNQKGVQYTQSVAPFTKDFLYA